MMDASGFEIYTDNRNKDIAAFGKRKLKSSLTSLNYNKKQGDKKYKRKWAIICY